MKGLDVAPGVNYGNSGSAVVQTASSVLAVPHPQSTLFLIQLVQNW